MTLNSIQNLNTQNVGTVTKATRWLICSGIVTLVLAFLCVGMAGMGMVRSFDSLATATTAPKPSDLANSIRVASLPLVASAPLAVTGIVLIIAGLGRRRRDA